MEGFVKKFYWIRRQLEVAVALAAFSIHGGAQEAGTKGAILQRLEAQFVPTETTEDKSDIVTAGSILTLKRDNLMTVAISSGSVCPNTYKDGKITQGTMAKITCGRAITLSSKRKIFLAGQKLWVTNIEVNDSSVVFDLYTDAYAGERYRATLAFPFLKGSVPPAESVQKVVAEVFTADPPPQPAATEPSPGAAPPPGGNARVPGAGTGRPPVASPPVTQEAALPPIEAPEAPPAEIRLGQTTQQVLASFGKPNKVEKPGANKEIYYYKDLKVTFTNDKVTDVQ